MDDEAFDAFGMSGGEAEAYGCSVIHQVDGVAIEPQLLGEAVHEDGEIIECVVKLIHGGLFAIAETRVVGGNEVILIGQIRDDVAEHVR